VRGAHGQERPSALRGEWAREKVARPPALSCSLASLAPATEVAGPPYGIIHAQPAAGLARPTAPAKGSRSASVGGLHIGKQATDALRMTASSLAE